MTKSTQRGKIGPYKLRTLLIRYLKKQSNRSFTTRQLIKKLGIKNTKDQLNEQLAVLRKKGMIQRNDDGSHSWKGGAGGKMRTTTGTVDMIRSGAAYIVPDRGEGDIYVSPKRLGSALDGDRVEIEVHGTRRGRSPEGSVIRVLERARETFVGTVLYTEREQMYVRLDPRDGGMEIRIHDPELLPAEGTAVVTRITKWRKDARGQLAGDLLQVLGDHSNSSVVMQDILIRNGFDIAFPKEVLEELNNIPVEISADEIASRRDMRRVATWTIDPHDAKDFDDAISLEYIEDGKYELGVHIADVTHYVRPGTALDREAYHRSTSVYLVDRVCPMLPERLSNELCSLRPQEDKLCFSAVFTFSPSHELIDRWMGRTVIHSDHRFSYEEAQEIIEGGEGPLSEEIKFINRLAKRLQKGRFKNGSIAFETEEVKFIMDEQGVPIESYTKVRKDAHMMIEDLMLLANREVATFIGRRKGREIPFVYRVHDMPDPDKVAELALYARDMGVEILYDTPKQLAKSFNRIVKKSETDDRLKLLMPLAIRTMAKAEYTIDNIGHYGLAFDYYAHFTSPIRRYADVLVHRILWENLQKPYYVKASDLEARCKYISNRERKAMAAERESIKYKQVEYIAQHVGETFDGIVSGMIDTGIFIELLPSRSEGMIRMDRLGGSYVTSDNRFTITDRETGDTIHMGDVLLVRVLEVDMERRQIELEWAEESAE